MRAKACRRWFAVAKERSAAPLVAVPGAGAVSDDSPLDYRLITAYSEESLASHFVGVHAKDLRYVAEWGCWMRWVDGKWVPEKTLLAFDLARAVAKHMARLVRVSSSIPDAARGKILRQILAKSTFAAIEGIARADRAIAATSAQWDSDAWLLNTPAGVIDLKTGELAEHKPELYLTKCTGAAPGGSAPRWLEFLRRVTGEDEDLISYLQRIVGYMLTGSTREQVLWFFYGTGANGKSTFVNAVSHALGDYAKSAPMETFVESVHDRHPTDIARLMGARLVTAQETEDGRRLAASRIKELTGGDTIAARFMHRDFFEYLPQFKLLLIGNHKPGLRNVDEAMRRRLHLVPFTITIPPEQRDKDLLTRLYAEAPGILQWALEGCLVWQRDGLMTPAAVRDATAAYLEDEDVLGAWIEERTERKRGAFSAGAALHRSYVKWAESAGEKYLGIKRFGQALEDRGFARARSSDARRARGFNDLLLCETKELPLND